MTIEAELVPLVVDADGEVRVGGTRVTLDSVVSAFMMGAGAEEIALRYPSLRLADIYTVLGYYLKHEPQMKAYLQERHALEEQVRRENEAHYNLIGLRERLLARLSNQEAVEPEPRS